MKPLHSHTTVVMNRFVLITKPEQSGKTFIMINEINRFQNDDYSCECDVVNFILCDNSLLLTTQTIVGTVPLKKHILT